MDMLEQLTPAGLKSNEEYQMTRLINMRNELVKIADEVVKINLLKGQKNAIHQERRAFD